MEKLSKKELINKWKNTKNEMLNEFSFCSEHKFNFEAKLICNKITLLNSFLFDLEFCLK